MAYCTNIYKCIDISLDRYEDLKKLEECMAENIKDGKYIEVDSKTYRECNISIPTIIGNDIYYSVDNMIDDNEIDFIRFYYEC